MKRLCILLSMSIMLVYLPIYPICTVPTSGTRVWNIAAENVMVTDTIESIVDAISVTPVTSDFNGTFTALAVISSELDVTESLAEALIVPIDALEQALQIDSSKLVVIADTLQNVAVELAAFDSTGVFTALEALQEDIASKLELLNDDLVSLEQQVINLTASEVDHGVTIASQLAVLEQEVMSINSILDSLSIEVDLEQMESLIDVIAQGLLTVDSRVDQLAYTITTDFAAVFTALEYNVVTLRTIESLADALSGAFIADMQDTFSALQTLEHSMNTAESLVHILDDTLMTIESVSDTVISQLDQTSVTLSSIISDLDNVQNLQSLYAVVDQTVSLLDRIDSIIEELNNNQLLVTAYTIESKLDIVNNGLASQQLELEVIDHELQTIESKTSVLIVENDVTLSNLDTVNVLLDEEQQAANDIASNLDVISIRSSNVDVIEVLVSAAESALDTIVQEVSVIDAPIASLQGILQTIESNLDVVSEQATSNLDNLIIIESRIDASPLPTSVISSIDSKIVIIEDLAFTAESKLDGMISLIDLLNGDAQTLIVDFQETWTILGSIDKTLGVAVSVLEELPSILKININDISSNISSIFTAIESILLVEEIVDSRLDSMATLMDKLISQQDAIAVEFTGVFTALEGLLIGASSIASQADIIESKVDIMRTYYGIPIYASSLPLTITKPERYFLAENINYGGSTNAITVNTNNVCIDLDDHVLTYTGVSSIVGIQINSSNVQINNGSILKFAQQWNVPDNINNVIIRNVNASGNAIFNNTRNSFVNNCVFIFGTSVDSFSLYGPTNLKITDCFFVEGQTALEVRSSTVNNVYVADCAFQSTEQGLGFNGTVNNYIAQRLYMDVPGSGMNWASGTIANFIGTDCIIQGSGGNGIDMHARGSKHVFLRNTITNCRIGIDVYILGGGSGPTRNAYFAFNTLVQNGTNLNEALAFLGPNTYLGNFAFNSTAVGNPPNTNYNIAISNITGKYVTISQSGSFNDRPTEWHNINMLP